jgi:hypothetical protein
MRNKPASQILVAALCPNFYFQSNEVAVESLDLESV